MEQRELAKLAGISVATLIRLEGEGWGPLPGSMKSVNAVLDVLEKNHVEFIDGGVRLTKRPRR